MIPGEIIKEPQKDSLEEYWGNSLREFLKNPWENPRRNL